MEEFKKPDFVARRRLLKRHPGNRCFDAGHESSITSASPSKSICSQVSAFSTYSCNLYKSVLNDCSMESESIVLNNSARIHDDVKKFSKTIWTSFVSSTTNEWQLHEFVEKRKERNVLTVTSKGILQKKISNFDRWWCVLTKELSLCIEGYLENKSYMTRSEPIIKRMDSHVVASQNSLCNLKGKFSDESCVPGIPPYIKERFSHGFPEDWKLLRKKWVTFLQKGQPRDFQWQEGCVAATLANNSTFHTANPFFSGESDQEAGVKDKIHSERFSRMFASADHYNNFVLGKQISTQHQNVSQAQIGFVESVTERVQPQYVAKCVNLHPDERPAADSERESILRRDDMLASPEETSPHTSGLNFCNKINQKSPSVTNTGHHINNNVSEQIYGVNTRGEKGQESFLTTRKKKLSTVIEFDPTDDSANEDLCDIDGTILKKQTKCPVETRKSSVGTQNNLKQKHSSERANVTSKPSTDDCHSSSRHSVEKRKVASGTIVNTEALEDKTVALKDWLPIFNRKNKHLCFQGVRCSGNEEKIYKTASMKSRIESDSAALIDGKICKLIGHLTDSDNSLPEVIKLQFQNGIPRMWRKSLETWATCNKNCSGTSATKSITAGAPAKVNIPDPSQGALRTSSRGRVLMQPLKHWLGETTASILQRTENDITGRSSGRQEECAQTKPLFVGTAQQKLGSSNAKKKSCVLNTVEAVVSKSKKDAVNSKRKKESVHGNKKNRKKVKQSSEQKQNNCATSDPVGNDCSPDIESENPNTETFSERRHSDTEKEIHVQKKSCDINNGSAVTNVSNTRCSNRIKNNKLINALIAKTANSENSEIDISSGDEKTNSRHQSDFRIQSASVGSDRCSKTEEGKIIVKKSKQKKQESCGLQIDFKELLGKPPRSLKQRRELEQVVKALSQNEKDNVDMFDEVSENHEADGMAWDAFVELENDGGVAIGEETPRSKYFNGSFYKTPEGSPSNSIFQITPFDKDEIRRIVHQQKTKGSKNVKKKESKRTKLTFSSQMAGGDKLDAAYTALMNGKSVSKFISNKELGSCSDELSSSELENSD